MSLDGYKILHIEPTSACNAACPQCSRETDKTFDKNNVSHLTLAQVKEHFDDSFIINLDKMFMCGTYGDPAAGKHTLEIFRYFRKINPNIVLGMNTNGGIKNSAFWKELATLVNYVVFSIDGLEDTNHIYRVNVNWKNVMRNAKTYINAGGDAHWDMLIFKHNEHQVSDAEQLSKDLKFSHFRSKVSRRFELWPVHFLKKPNSAKEVIHTGPINCIALSEKSIYLAADNKLFPCCFLSITNYTFDKFDEVKSLWSTTPPIECKVTCSSASNAYNNQWKE